MPPEPDDDLTRRLALLIERGNVVDVAAQGAGISPRTFYRWIDKGRVAEDELAAAPELAVKPLRALIARRELKVKAPAKVRAATLRARVVKALERDPYLAFRRAIEEAKVKCETDLVATIEKQAATSYRAAAFILERRFPERWAKLSVADVRERRMSEPAAPAPPPAGKDEPDGDEGAEETEAPNPAARIRDELAARRAQRA